jgi:hypothetical protein
MLAERHVGGPVGRQHEQSHLIQPPGEIVQHVDGRDIGPVEIVEKQHERPQSRRLLQECAKLALHPFLRDGGRLFPHAREGVLTGRRVRDLHVPRGRDAFDQRVHRDP